MSPPDKSRRGTASTANPRSKETGASPSSSQPISRKEIIAPPIRAQLTSSSPSPEDQQSRKASNGAATSRSRRSSNAPSTRSLSATSTTNPSSAAAGSPSSETITTAALLKEKDARIASLERDVSIMETEFRRELDKLSHSESETASFWQTKHSALNQQFLRMDTELRLLRDVMRSRETETEEATQGWRATLRSEIAGRDDEIRDLRAQIRGLKEWVSTSTRADGTANTSDEVFGEGMARLGNGLQNWVITNYRRAKIDLATADQGTLQELSELVPMYEELAQTSKVYLLQSLVSRILVRRIFGAYFVGLSTEQEEQLRQTEKTIAALGSTESVNNWRSVTLSILKKEATDSIQEQTAGLIEKVAIATTSLLSAITTDSSNASTAAPNLETRDQVLRQLITSAVELSRLLVVQKAVFEVWMPDIVPHQRILFDHSIMEDIGGEDEESLVQREICCVTFPGIIKRGDENGAHQLQFRNVIAKAKTLCTPE